MFQKWKKQLKYNIMFGALTFLWHIGNILNTIVAIHIKQRLFFA